MLVILLLSDRNKVIEFVSWGMGRMPVPASDFAALGGWACVVAVGWAWLFLLGNQFNTLGLGDAVRRPAACRCIGFAWRRSSWFGRSRRCAWRGRARSGLSG